MSTISTGTTTTNAFVVTGDTTGGLTIQTGATPTTAMTISSAQVVTFTNSPVFSGTNLSFSGYLQFNGSSSGYVRLQAAAAAGSATYTLPSADGAANTYLKTNGAGTLSWSTVATGAQDYVLMFSYGIV